MTRHFPPSPFGTTMMGADQLDCLLSITFCNRSLLISSLNPFVMFHSLLDKDFVKLVENHWYLLLSWSVLWSQWWFHPEQTKIGIPLRVPLALFQYLF